MNLEYFLIGLAVFIAGFVWGWLNHAYTFFNRVKENPDEFIELLKKYKTTKNETTDSSNKNEETSRSLKVERHGDQLYIYTKDTDEFLAQGSTLQDALDNVQKRFPGRVFNGRLSKEEADTLGITVK